MPLKPIGLSSLKKIGVGLQRPEDVVVSKDGRVWASDQASACAEIMQDGGLRRVGKAGGAPNGINMDLRGRIVICNFEEGPVQRLDTETGEVEVICEEAGGRKLTSANYPIYDSKGNLWFANSTWTQPWQQALDDRKDGTLFRMSADGKVETMAEEIQFANGLALDADESHIYVCETTGCDVMRFPIRGDGSLGPRERYGPVLGKTAFGLDPDNPPGLAELAQMGLTDGCGFDQEGNLWVTLVAASKVVAITPGGEVVTMIEDPSFELMVRPTNVSWGGPDMSDLYIGTIEKDYVLHARSPIPGLPLVHQR